MKNYIADDNVFTAPAPAAVTKDVPLLMGTLFVIPSNTTASGELCAFVKRGKVKVPKVAAQAWATVGAKVYWDDTAKNVTTTSSGNSLIGAVAEAALSADTVGYVLLNVTTI